VIYTGEYIRDTREYRQIPVIHPENTRGYRPQTPGEYMTDTRRIPEDIDRHPEIYTTDTRRIPEDIDRHPENIDRHPENT